MSFRSTLYRWGVYIWIWKQKEQNIPKCDTKVTAWLRSRRFLKTYPFDLSRLHRPANVLPYLAQFHSQHHGKLGIEQLLSIMQKIFVTKVELISLGILLHFTPVQGTHHLQQRRPVSAGDKLPVALFAQILIGNPDIFSYLLTAKKRFQSLTIKDRTHFGYRFIIMGRDKKNGHRTDPLVPEHNNAIPFCPRCGPPDSESCKPHEHHIPQSLRYCTYSSPFTADIPVYPLIIA